MTEADARILLHNWPSVGGLEAWIAGRQWKAVPGDWIVAGVLEGWHFRVDVVASGLQITASMLGGSDPAVWVVTS